MLLFPIGDKNITNGSKPILSWLFIAINVGVYIYQATLGKEGIQEFINQYGLIPSNATQGEDWITAWTSMFLHAGPMHLIGNMLFLFVFADNIEASVGHWKFFLFYFLGGLAAALCQTFMNINSDIPMVGASGCISACLGAYLVMFPKARIKLLLILFVIRIPAFVFLGLWGLQQFLAGYNSLFASQDTGGVAYWAHIGGFIFGLVAGFYFRRTVVLEKLDES